MVMNDRNGRYENRSATFFQSAHVGMHTIQVLDLIHQVGDLENKL